MLADRNSTSADLCSLSFSSILPSFSPSLHFCSFSKKQVRRWWCRPLGTPLMPPAMNREDGVHADWQHPTLTAPSLRLDPSLVRSCPSSTFLFTYYRRRFAGTVSSPPSPCCRYRCTRPATHSHDQRLPPSPWPAHRLLARAHSRTLHARCITSWPSHRRRTAPVPQPHTAALLGAVAVSDSTIYVCTMTWGCSWDVPHCRRMTTPVGFGRSYHLPGRCSALGLPRDWGNVKVIN